MWRATTFSDDRVTSMAARLGLTLTHDAQWTFLRSATSIDLQAAPGSGKTSLVALKLLLLAEQWSSRGQGICVLSHTNTAKNEILERLSATPAGRLLSGRPHFIGTIQAFANTFFALPRLRDAGIDVHMIDDDAYAAAARREIARDPSYQALRTTLSHHKDGDRILTEAEYVFNGRKAAVDISRLDCSLQTDSAQQFIKLKTDLAKKGIFRYTDMFATALDSLTRYPDLAKDIQQRFPFVLIDEMQDTSRQQDDLLSAAFGTGEVVVQRVGDHNQRIFDGCDDTAGSRAATSTTIDLAVSRRFGPDIARVASALTVHKHQTIEGAGPAGRLVLIVFDDDSIHRVIPAFEELAADTVPHDLLVASPPQVLGARRSPGSSKKTPQSIECYSAAFAAANTATKATGLIDVARRAQQAVESAHDVRDAVDLLWNAVRDVVRLCARMDTTGQPLQLPPLNRLDRTAGSPGLQIRLALAAILEGDLDSEAVWTALAAQLVRSLGHLVDIGAAIGREARHRLEFTPLPEQPASDREPDSEPDPPARGVPGRLGTIQSAKGETHSATLILECLDRMGQKHNVPEALAVICGDAIPKEGRKLVREALQLVFVGATRPTHLLAMAVHEARAMPYLDRLQASGWDIHLLSGLAVPANITAGGPVTDALWIPGQRDDDVLGRQTTLWP